MQYHYHAESTYTLTWQFSEAHFWVVLDFSQSGREEIGKWRKLTFVLFKRKGVMTYLTTCSRAFESLPATKEHPSLSSRWRIFCSTNCCYVELLMGRSSVALITCVKCGKLCNFVAFEIGEGFLFLSSFEFFRVLFFFPQAHSVSDTIWFQGFQWIGRLMDWLTFRLDFMW